MSHKEFVGGGGGVGVGGPLVPEVFVISFLLPGIFESDKAQVTRLSWSLRNKSVGNMATSLAYGDHISVVNVYVV